VIQGYLTSDGHKADSAMNALEGLKKIREKSYDLLITDWAMPEMNGGEFSAIVKKELPGMPIIMLTGFGELMKTRGEKLEGVRVLLSKPLTMDELRSALWEVFTDGR
jgi:DNA-binding NtrC family response regulator